MRLSVLSVPEILIKRCTLYNKACVFHINRSHLGKEQKKDKQKGAKKVNNLIHCSLFVLFSHLNFVAFQGQGQEDITG